MARRRHIPAICSIVLVLVSVSNARDPASSQSPDPAAIQPLLAKYCADCHGPAEPEAKLTLAPSARQDLSAWKRVWDRLRSGEMPPAEHPQPTAAQRQQLFQWLEDAFARPTLGSQRDPGPLMPRRLNAREHMNSFRDLAVVKSYPQPRKNAYTIKPDGSLSLYGTIIPLPEHPCDYVGRILPPDTSDGGFDTIGDNLTIPNFLIDRYFKAAKQLCDEMFVVNAKTASSYQWPLYQQIARLRDQPPPKNKTAEQAVREFLQEFAGRAFRRPVSVDEAAKLYDIFARAQAQGSAFDEAIRLPLETVLVSPQFVLLWADLDPLPPTSEPLRVQPLDDHQLAARLSYFLWSSVPDRELTQAAQSGKLRDPAIYEQQVRRLLNDRRVLDGIVIGFLGQWLQLDRLDRNAPDAETYPEYFQNNLAELMKRELLLFCDAIVAEDRSILDFVDADWGFLCYPLAEHYAVAEFPGKKTSNNADPPWYRVTFRDRRRGGVLTLGKVLTGVSQPKRTSPVRRGKWLLETIFAAPPPPPPPDVNNELPEPKAADDRLTVPQLLARHRDNAACVSCHRMIDPLGLALENYDPTGRWRENEFDRPIDSRATLANGRKVDGVVGLKTLLVEQKEQFVRAFVQQMLTYALGRQLEYYDVPTVEEITRAVLQDDARFSRVVLEVAKSYPFMNRRAHVPAE